MFKKTVLSRSLVLAFSSTTLCGTVAFAQDAQPAPPTGNSQLERVTVTGSNIRRIDNETPSPVQVITADDLKKSGYTNASDVLRSITANNSGTLSQGFSQAFASGASGVALRGLSVGATLVLIDGHRMAPYPLGDDGQRSFVDISNIPFDAIERIEVLKDGASAIYGSDAMAGVVNVILKRSYVGKTITADYGTSYKNDGNTSHVSGMFGIGDLDTDGHNAFLAIEYRHQNQITFAQRGGLLTQTDFTSSGGLNLTRGVPNVLNGGLPASATGYVVNPSTGAIAGFMPGCNSTTFAAGQCTFNNTWSQIQPTTQNINLVGKYSQNFSDDWKGSVQATYFESSAQQVLGPSAAFSSGYQGIAFSPTTAPTLLAPLNPTTISSTNPSFPAGTGITSGTLYDTFLGLGPNVTNTDAKASRVVADLSGHLGTWDLSASLGFTQVLLNVKSSGNINPANLQSALDSTTDPFLVGGAISAANSALISPQLVANDSSKLQFVHVSASHDLLSLGGGPLSLALGGDFVHRSLDAVAPAAIAQGVVSGNNAFAIGSQEVGSAFAEVVAPFTKTFEAEAAVRYDHYNLSGGKATPKVGFKFQPVPEFGVRGTVSTGFRAPGPGENGNAGQSFLAAGSTDPVLCPGGDPTAVGVYPTQCNIQPVGALRGNPALKPETSDSGTFGLLFQPIKSVSLSADIYTITIKNQIVPTYGIDWDSNVVRGTNLTPIPYVQSPGVTVNQAPPVAPLAYFNSSYINANKTRTSGIDLDAEYKTKVDGVGNVSSDLQVTRMFSYVTTIDGVSYQLAGTHGPFGVSGDTGTPKSRLKWSTTVARDAWQVTGTVNYIGSFGVTDPSQGLSDCPTALAYGGGAASSAYNLTGGGSVPSQSFCRVASFTTFDASGRFDVTKQLSLHGSVLNLFNRVFPADWSTYGGGGAPYNPAMHSQGAIGRYFNVGATYTF